MPLPAGIMRLYKEDDEGSLQFIGEDKIAHTPEKEEVKLTVGKAFDIICEKRQTEFKQLSTRQFESAWGISLRNHKKDDVIVKVIETLPTGWEMLENSHDYEKLDAFRIKFEVKVPADNETKIKYRVRVGI